MKPALPGCAEVVHQKMAFAAWKLRPLILCEYAHAMGNSLGGSLNTGRHFVSTPVYRAASSGLGGSVAD